MNPQILILIVLGIVGFVFAAIILKFFGLWLKARVSQAGVSMANLVGMWIRRVSTNLIVDARISIIKAGLSITTDELEAHYLAGGDIINVVKALIAADKANIELSFQHAAAIDLAGRNVEEAVRTSVNPKVIDCPAIGTGSSGTGMLDAVAKDGIRLLVKARVTVRANLERLVGGASEDTIVARVGTGHCQCNRFFRILQGCAGKP